MSEIDKLIKHQKQEVSFCQNFDRSDKKPKEILQELTKIKNKEYLHKEEIRKLMLSEEKLANAICRSFCLEPSGISRDCLVKTKNRCDSVKIIAKSIYKEYEKKLFGG